MTKMHIFLDFIDIGILVLQLQELYINHQFLNFHPFFSPLQTKLSPSPKLLPKKSYFFTHNKYCSSNSSFFSYSFLHTNPLFFKHLYWDNKKHNTNIITTIITTAKKKYISSLRRVVALPAVFTENALLFYHQSEESIKKIK